MKQASRLHRAINARSGLSVSLYRSLAVGSILAILAAGCTTEERVQEDRVAPAPTIDLATTGLIQQVPCTSDGLCAEEFGLNGRVYVLSCGLVDPESVDLENELGRGHLFDRDVAANAVLLSPGVAADTNNNVIAVSAPEATGCTENPGPDTPTSPWRLAFAGPIEPATICSIGLFTAEERVEEECESAG
jgi:hypothetical protein